MRTLQMCGFLLTSSISLGLLACGAGSPNVTTPAPVTPAPVTPAPVPSPPTTLTGNWLLAGSRAPAAYPLISTSLIVQGTTITGQTAISTQCGGTGTLSSTISAEGFPVSGTIANDGTFQANTGGIGHAPDGVLTLSLVGSSPLASAPSTWAGTYSLTFTPGSTGVSCSVAETGSFVASSIAPITGTYTGVPTNTNPPFGAGANVSVQIMQGAPALVTRGTASRYEIPLTATLTVANSSCSVPPLTTMAMVPAFLSGDSFQLAFLTTSSQGESLIGTLSDSSANTFSGILASVGAVTCGSGLGDYTFTRK